MNVSVIIPNYNSASTIRRTLESIKEQHFSIYEIIVIDDASTDESVALITSIVPTATIYRNQHNRGAAYTRNIGIRYASGDLLVFVDSDVVIEKGSLKKLIAASQFADIGFPKIVYENRMSMYPNRKEDTAYLLITPFFLISRTALGKLHESFFDEAYTGYCEDTDFFLKCKLFGLRCTYVDSARGIHITHKPANREDRYYSEVVSTIHGAIKFWGYGELRRLDHAFKLANIAKLYLIGLFNFRLFDAQLFQFNKGGSVFYKATYLLRSTEKITDKGRFYLLTLTAKGIACGLRQYKTALAARKKLKQDLLTHKQSLLKIIDISYGAREGTFEAAATHTHQLAQNLGKRHHTVYLITSGNRLQTSQNGFVDHTILPMHLYGSERSLLRLGKNILVNNILLLRQLYSLRGYDIIYERLSFTLVSGLFYAKYFRLPLVYEVNGIPDEEMFLLFRITPPWLKWLISTIVGFQLRRATAVVVQSTELKHILEARFHVRALFVIPNGTAAITGIQKVRHQRIRFLYVGILDELHNLDIIFSVLHARTDLFEFFIVGDGPRSAFYQQQYQADTRFTFIGQVRNDQALRYITEADICLASYSPQYTLFQKYGFYLCPLKLFEYMAAGKAIILFGARNALLTQFLHKRALTLVHDTASFKATLSELMTNSVLRAQLRRNAVAVSRAYTWENTSKKLEYTLLKCL